MLLSEKAQIILHKVKGRVKKNFRFATLDFLFIIAYIQVFQMIFGPENSIVAVIFTILMGASMLRDLTSEPVRHLIHQGLVLVLMAGAAWAVSVLNPWAAFPVNFAVLFLILYAFTYEYMSHLYFPYILSYLFLIFISPVGAEGLKKRLLAMVFGAVSIILYQLYMGRNRVAETAQGSLKTILEEARDCIRSLQKGENHGGSEEEVRSSLCRLSTIIYQRRKRALCISDASFSMLDVGRGLENLIVYLCSLDTFNSPDRQKLLEKTDAQLSVFQDYLEHRLKTPPPMDWPSSSETDPVGDHLRALLSYIHTHLIRMTSPSHRAHYRKTVLSFSVRLKSALQISPVRICYALRVGLLLALATLAVHVLELPHGKWLLFTIASVSLPYADDVPKKAYKRTAATLMGGLIGFVLYALIPSPGGRTFVMMAAGYLTFYFSDYMGTFSCSTLGALGGAVFASAFGWGEVGTMFFVRAGYVLLGVTIALLCNCVFFPFRRELASKQLWKKYTETISLLSEICKKEIEDVQLYYHLVIQSHLLEKKLIENAEAGGAHQDMKELLSASRQAVREAHRKAVDACAS